MESLLQEVLEGFQLSNVSKCIAAAMLTWVVWDHLLTIAEDLRFIRKLRREYLGASLFLMNRYGTEAGMAFIMWMQHYYSGNTLNNSMCGTLFDISAFPAIIWLATENATMTLRMYTLWERRKSTLHAIWIALSILCVGVLISAGLALKSIHDDAIVVPFINLCDLPIPPRLSLAGLWAFLLAYDLFMLVMFVSNALDQPYRRSSEVFVRLKRNGIVVYCLLAVTRLCNLLAALTLSSFYVFALFLIEWAISTIGLSRLLIQAESIDESSRGEYRYAYELSYRYA